MTKGNRRSEGNGPFGEEMSRRRFLKGAAMTGSGLVVWSALGGATAPKALALGRRWIGLGRPEWRALHLALAVAILGSAFAHAVMIQGALDGPVGTLLLYGGMAIAGASVLYAGLPRLLRLRDRGPTRREEPRAGNPAP